MDTNFKLGFSWWSVLGLEWAAVLAEALLALFNGDSFPDVQQKLFYLEEDFSISKFDFSIEYV